MKAPLVRLYARCFLVFVSIILWSTANATLYSHNGEIDPLTEGWTFLDTNPGVSVGPVSDNGTNAWSINDSSSASGSRTRYNITPLPQEAADAMQNGWILRANLRVVNTNDALDNSILIEYNDGNRRFLVRFGSDSVGDPLVQLEDSVSTTVHVVTGGANQYNLYELVYDPQTQRASLFVNSQPTNITNQPGTDGTSVARRINWGSGGSGDTGHAQYNLVEWQIARDSDADFIIDYLDNCPYVENNLQTDTGGVGFESPPDGIGDACQCGDLTLDGFVDQSDVDRLRAFLSDPDNADLTTEQLFRCGVYDNFSDCNVLNVAVMERAIADLNPNVIQVCAAADVTVGDHCGDGLCSASESCLISGCQEDCGKCLLNDACVRNDDCASNQCDNNACVAPLITPSAPSGCGDGICSGSESCSRSGIFGCFSDCGPCEANPDDSVNPDYCINANDCGSGQFCVDAGRCQDDDSRLCVEDADCDTGTCVIRDFAPRHLEFQAFRGLCSDLTTQCQPTYNPFDSYSPTPAPECADNDLCYPTQICTEALTDGCGRPPMFARLCNLWEDCSDDVDCNSGICYNTILGLPLGGGAVANSCIPELLPDGYPCTFSEDCENNSCILGRCRGDTGLCLSNSDCLNNERCVGFPGVCVESGCGDGMCSDLEACHVQPMQFVSPIEACQEDCGLCETGHSCGDNSDCISGDCNSFFGCQSRCGDGVCDSVEDCTTSLTSPLNNLCRADCGACANGDRCNANADCVNDCISGRCAPTPPTCNDMGNCPNGGECTSNSQCESERCLDSNGPLPGGDRFCVPSGCTAPGAACISSDACCDFPGVDLSCNIFVCTN